MDYRELLVSTSRLKELPKRETFENTARSTYSSLLEDSKSDTNQKIN
jgi:hypothetical protein